MGNSNSTCSGPYYKHCSDSNYLLGKWNIKYSKGSLSFQ